MYNTNQLDPNEILVEVSIEGLTGGQDDIQACGRALLTLVRYYESLQFPKTAGGYKPWTSKRKNKLGKVRDT